MMSQPESIGDVGPAVRHNSRRLVILFLLAAFAWPVAAHAAEVDSDLEVRVKAAFLYKFTGYIEWSDNAFPQADSPIVIAVMGSDAIAGELGQITEGRKVNGHPIQVKRLKPGDALTGVHILFVGDSLLTQIGAVMRAARQLGVLTVTESEGGLAQGSVINFIVSDRRVRFEISRDSANKNRIRLSSRLLAVAQNVKE